MTTKPEAIVVEHGGKSYIRLLQKGTYYGHDWAKNIAANGAQDLPQAPGDSAFLVCESKVETLERIVPPRRITTKYELREDLRGSSKEPLISVEQYRSLTETDQMLYRPVHEDIPRQADPIAFVTQKEKGPPSQLPKGIVCIDTNHFARFPSFHHLGPVRATGAYVLWRTAKRVEEIVKGNPFVSFSAGWGRDIDKFLNEPAYHETFFVEVKQMEVNGITIAAVGMKLEFTLKRDERTRGYTQKLGYIDGDNLEDLERRVTDYVAKVTAHLAAWCPPKACPCCKRKFTKPVQARPKSRR